MKSQEKVKQALETAVEGLLYPSESDEPFRYICWQGVEELNSTRLLDLLGLPAETGVESQSPDDFFAELVEEQEGWGDAEKADAERYQALRRILEAHLDSLHIFRVGEVEVGIYLLGHCEGDLVGLRTLSVET